MSNQFELVYTVQDYWDGPRQGIADFQGVPHIYERQFDKIEDDWSDTFLLAPIDEKSFNLAMDAWAIWKRHLKAVERKEVLLSTHSVLPEDKERYEQIKPAIDALLELIPVNAIRAKAEFRTIQGSGSQAEWQVRWSSINL